MESKTERAKEYGRNLSEKILKPGQGSYKTLNQTDE